MQRTNILISFVVAVAVLVGVVIFTTNTPARATEDDLSGLISGLWDRVLEEQTDENSSDFTFVIGFADSISGMGTSVTLGQGLDTLRIDSIGSDHVCFARVFSRDMNYTCIPFTQIATVSYRDAN